MTTCFLTYLHMDGGWKGGHGSHTPNPDPSPQTNIFWTKIQIQWYYEHIHQILKICLRQVLQKVEEFIFYSKYCQTFPDPEKVLNRFIKWHHQTVCKKNNNWILNEQHEFFTNNWTWYFHPKLSSSIGTRHPTYLTSLTSYIRVSTNYTRMHSSRVRTVRTLPYGGRQRPPLDRDRPRQRHPRAETRDPVPGQRPRPPPRGQTDTCENINFANFVCGR